MEFRFTFDPNGSPVILADQPIGWDEIEINVKRDPVIKGHFIVFTSDLEFHGDGFTFLSAEIAASICNTVDILIEFRHSELNDFKILFNGLIELSDVESNLSRNRITAKIESNNLSSLIRRNFDIDVPIDNGFTLGGATLFDIGIATDIHEIVGLIGPFPRRAYLIDKVFQYILDYITESAVTFTSDFYETETNQIEKYNLNFISLPFVIGNTITVEYDNFFGEHVIVTSGFNADDATTLSDLEKALHVQQPGLVTLVPSSTNVLERFPFVLSDGVDDIDIESWLPVTNVTCVVTGGASQPTCAVLKTQSITTGQSNLVLSNGFLIDNIAKKPIISLKTLFEGLTKLHDISFGLTAPGGVPTFNVAQTADFFDLTASLTLDNVKNVTFKLTDEFIHTAAESAGMQDFGDRRGVAWDLENYNTDSCFGQSLDLKTEFVVNSLDIQSTLVGPARFFEDELFLIQTTDNTGANSEVYRIREFNTTNAAFSSTFFLHNAFLISLRHVIYNNFSINADTIGIQDRSFPNTASLNLNKVFKFEHKLSKTEFDTITADTNKPINFNIDGSTNIKAWIKDIKYNINEGIAFFDLYGE